MKFAKALEFLRRKSVMPTELRSWALQELPVEVRERAFFSATVTNAIFLQEALDAVEAIVYATSDRATMRTELRTMLDRIGYLPQDSERGTLTDLRSDRRLNLILDTNAAQARAYGRHKIEQAPEILDAYPAAELIRIGAYPEEPRPWPQKWQRAGGRLYEGRMIARKDDPLWSLSIDAGGFNRFGTKYGPFDFNSGMRQRNVSRAEAERLGVIQPGERVRPDQDGFNASLSASAEGLSPELLAAVEQSGIATRDATGRWVPAL